MSRFMLAGAMLVVGMSAAQACDRGVETCSFKLFNNTSHVVESFWASPARISKWEEDIFGTNVLPAGGEVNVNLSDGRPDCIYDFRFKFDDGDMLTRKGINICKLGRYTLDE